MADLILPVSLTGKKELIKVQRELEALSEQMIQARVVNKETGKTKSLPALSDLANELIVANKVMMDSASVTKLIEELGAMRDAAPSLRISFASEPDNAVKQKIVSWFRKEIDPNLLIQVGIQPSIAGGCIVNTNGNRYDFSLRKNILGSTDKFREVLSKKVGEKAEEALPVSVAEGATEPKK